MQLSIETGEKKVIHYKMYNDEASKIFRGSGGPVPYKDGYLVLTHEVKNVPR